MKYGLLCALCLFARLVSADPVQATFTWQPVDNADGYALYHEDALLAEVTNETTYSEVLDLAPGPNRFAMQAFNDVGPGPRRTITRTYTPPRTAPTDAPEFDVVLLVQGTGGNPGGGNEPDITPPLAPVGIFNNNVTATTARTNWSSNGEPDLQDYRVYRSSVGPSSGFSLVGTVSAPASFFDHTGLSAETQQYWVYVTARDNVGNESEASEVRDFTTEAAGADPYDMTPFNVQFPVNFPAPPQTTDDVTVTSVAEWNAAIAQGARIIRVNNSMSGNVVLSGANDIDIIMDNSAVLNGTVSSANFGSNSSNRVRWTGGTVRAVDEVGGGLELRQVNDYLFNNVRFETSIATRTDASGFNRLAFINVTLDPGNGPVDNQFQFFVAEGARNFDLFIGNLLAYDKTTTNQIMRIQRTTRVVVVDSYINPLGNSNGLRFSENCQDVYVAGASDSKRMIQVQRQHMSHPITPAQSVAGFTSAIVNGLWDQHVHHYRDFEQFATQIDGNTGTVRNYTMHSQSGAGSTLSVSPMTDGGGNSIVSWDGVTLPPTTGYGADH